MADYRTPVNPREESCRTVDEDAQVQIWKSLQARVCASRDVQSSLPKFLSGIARPRDIGSLRELQESGDIERRRDEVRRISEQ